MQMCHFYLPEGTKISNKFPMMGYVGGPGILLILIIVIIPHGTQYKNVIKNINPQVHNRNVTIIIVLIFFLTLEQ